MKKLVHHCRPLCGILGPDTHVMEVLSYHQNIELIKVNRRHYPIQILEVKPESDLRFDPKSRYFNPKKDRSEFIIPNPNQQLYGFLLFFRPAPSLPSNYILEIRETGSDG